MRCLRAGAHPDKLPLNALLGRFVAGRKISTIIWTAATASQSPLPPLVPARNTASQSGKDSHEVPSASRPPLPLSPARLAKMSQDGTRSRNASSGEVAHVDGDEQAVQGKAPSITSGAKGGHSSARLLVARQSGVQRASNQTATTHNSSSTHAMTKSGRLSLRTYDSSGAAHDLMTLMTPPYHNPSITRSSSASVTHHPAPHHPASLSANHQHHVSAMQTLVEGQPLVQHAGGKQQQQQQQQHAAEEGFFGLPNVTIQLAPSIDSKVRRRQRACLRLPVWPLTARPPAPLHHASAAHNARLLRSWRRCWRRPTSGALTCTRWRRPPRGTRSRCSPTGCCTRRASSPGPRLTRPSSCASCSESRRATPTTHT